METSVWGGLWQGDSRMSERQGSPDGSKTCYDVWTLTKREEAELEVAELKGVKISSRVTRTDRIRKENGSAQPKLFGDKEKKG